MGIGMLLMHRAMPAQGMAAMHTSPVEVVATVAQGLLVALAAVALLQPARRDGRVWRRAQG